MDNPWQTLGITPDDSIETAKKAFRKRAGKAHPDRGGSAQAFQKLRLAYEIVSDPVKRKLYENGFAGNETVDELSKATVVEIFGQLIAEIEQGADIGQNLITEAIRVLRGQKIKKESQRIAIEKKRLKLTACRSRVTTTADIHNYFACAVDERLAKLNRETQVVEHAINVLQGAIEIVKLHTDNPPQSLPAAHSENNRNFPWFPRSVVDWS